MVVVPKKSNRVRICVDYRALNESVPCEVHPLPKVDDTSNSAQMAGATVFSKLRANCGFWQIPLNESCSQLSSPHLAATISSGYHLASAVLPSTFSVG